ncbi:ATP-binding protein [Burkholderia gladioli]|uniref:ATP-binding protein n=1 Tax=Burkholderia gladioli TaxID=28095 RepID=UPI001ABAECAD|nr:ATP-binding protein [Burkholderia gladioli]
MTQPDLSQRLSSLIATWENEVAEFKQADNNYSTDEIGKYFSALANEANLRHTDGGWLVFGVSNKTRRVVGTDYRPQSERLQSLKMQIAENAEPRLPSAKSMNWRTPMAVC